MVFFKEVVRNFKLIVMKQPFCNQKKKLQLLSKHSQCEVLILLMILRFLSQYFVVYGYF